MQDRYVGDIGDYIKYALLRQICGIKDVSAKELSLAVLWYLVPEENHNNDGVHTEYLKDENRDRFYSFDSPLYDAIYRIIKEKRHPREVPSIEKEGILPKGTVFYRDYLTYADIPAGNPAGQKQRKIFRKEWFHRALEISRNSDVVFLDPDNGLEVPSCHPFRDKGVKYVSKEEMEILLTRSLKQTIILYQHKQRKGFDQQIADQKRVLHELGADTVFSVKCSNYSQRVFYVIPSHRDIEIICRRMEELKRIINGKNTAIKMDIEGYLGYYDPYSVYKTPVLEDLSPYRLLSPSRFFTRIMQGMSGVTDITYLAGQGMVMKRSGLHNKDFELARDTFLQPSPQVWRELLGIVEKYDMANWKRETSMIYDAGSWEFYLQWGDREIRIQDYDHNIPGELKEFMENLSLLPSTV